MAYNDNSIGLRVGAAGNQAAIVVGDAVQSGDVQITEAADFYKDLLKSFHDAMVDFQNDQGGGAPSGEQMLADTMGATPVADAAGGFEVRILGKQHGPIPAWLNAACMKAGVTAVFDNRVDKDGNDITGTKRPWFRSPREPKDGGPADKPFWPPR